jgi:NAD(P)H-flavin reductase
MLPEPYAVRAKRRDTFDTWTLELEPRSGTRLDFEPGQFTMLAAFGAGEVPISISGAVDGPLIHTVRAVGLATAAICDAREGDVLGVRGAFGEPWPIEQLAGSNVVFVAGGIGLAPLRPAILAVLAQPERFGHVTLLYGGRSPDQLLYGDDLRAWAQAGLEVLVTVDSAGPEWLGHVGVVPRLIRRAAIDPERTAALLCGPEIMMRFTAAALGEHGIGPERVYASIERNMQCGIGHCGHCQLGPSLVCRDGPVYRWSEIAPWLAIREL